ncbi:MAG: serine/threonine-protein kinase, partial [Planctomycetota bacterium]|nr:serine/threonine-protein kinase [Planctomycetota bacterium]
MTREIDSRAREGFEKLSETPTHDDVEKVNTEASPVEQESSSCTLTESDVAQGEETRNQTDADLQSGATLDEPMTPLNARVTTRPTAAGSPEAGRFQVSEILGRGGQGEVWKAVDPELDREVALKVIKPGLKGSQPTLTQFQREAEMTGKLEHPNIIPIYEAGKATSDGSPYYVMRILREHSLQVAIDAFHRSLADVAGENRNRSRRGDTLSEHYTKGLRELLNRFVDICDALAYAHSRGVIHRDLKPANVMLGKFGETLVVDWGLATVVARTDLNNAVGIDPVQLS